MTEPSIDNEEAILLKEAEIQKANESLDALRSIAARSPSTNHPPAGTSLAERNVTDNTNDSNNTAITAPEQQTKAAKNSESEKDDDLLAIYDADGKLRYTKSIFENLSEEFHTDLINLILYTVEKHEYFKMKTVGIANLRRTEFIPKRLQVVNKIHLEFHDDNACSCETCANLKQ